LQDLFTVENCAAGAEGYVSRSPRNDYELRVVDSPRFVQAGTVAPVIAELGTSLRGVETLDSFVCRGRNGAGGGKISEHGRANALDVRALRLADGSTIALTDERVAKSLRENLRQSACRRFTTVLGNGAERSNHYRICQWDVLDVAESAALAAKKVAQGAANAVPERDIPLPRPRPVINGDASSSLAQHRRERSREAGRNAIFDLMRPLTRFVH
jgi:Extensin-like protein C-terminus